MALNDRRDDMRLATGILNDNLYSPHNDKITYLYFYILLLTEMCVPFSVFVLTCLSVFWRKKRVHNEKWPTDARIQHSANAKCQRVLALALCLVRFVVDLLYKKL